MRETEHEKDSKGIKHFTRRQKELRASGMQQAAGVIGAGERRENRKEDKSQFGESESGVNRVLV